MAIAKIISHHNLPPPSISVCKFSKFGNFNILALISVHIPTAQNSAWVVSVARGVISKHATSKGVVVELQKIQKYEYHNS